MRFTSSISGLLVSSLLVSSALGGVLRDPTKRQDLALGDEGEVDDMNEDIIEDIEEIDDDSIEDLGEAAEENQPDKRSIVVRAVPDGFAEAKMGEDPAVGAQVYTEGLATCIGLLVSGKKGEEWIHVLDHFHPNESMGDQWKKFKEAVYGAGMDGVYRSIISTSNPDQLPESAADAKDDMTALNGHLSQLMTNLLQGAAPEDFPHDGNKALQLPHGTIKAYGETIEVNGNAV